MAVFGARKKETKKPNMAQCCGPLLGYPRLELFEALSDGGQNNCDSFTSIRFDAEFPARKILFLSSSITLLQITTSKSSSASVASACNVCGEWP